MAPITTVIFRSAGVFVLAASAAFTETPVGSTFTYQGRLVDAGTPANGSYDLRFALYDAAEGGSRPGLTIIKEDVAVTGGLFTVTLDFGTAVFVGSARWLEIGVRPGASTGAFVPLSSRQELTPVPYALHSLDPNVNGTMTINSDAATDMLLSEGGVDRSSGVVETFTVQNSGAGTMQMQVEGGTGIPGAAAPAYSFLGDPNTGIYSSAADTLNFATGGVTRLVIDATGKVITTGDMAVGSNLCFGLWGAAGASGISARGPLVLTYDDDNNETDSHFAVWGGNNLQMRIEDGENATASFDGVVVSNGLDYAEAFRVADPSLEPGDVVAIDLDRREHVRRAAMSYDPNLVGVVSRRPGFVTGQSFEAEESADPHLATLRGEARKNRDSEAERRLTAELQEKLAEQLRPVALAGRVPVKVDGAFGAIRPGDRLTSSPTPGHAMAMRHEGQSIGIALDGRDGPGKGQVLVLIQPGWWAPARDGAAEGASRDLARLRATVQALAARLQALEVVRTGSRAASGDTERR